jgi:hypothetical protein
MDAMAITITNLPAFARKPSIPHGMGMNVLMMEAATKPSTNHGNIFAKRKLPPFSPEI